MKRHFIGITSIVGLIIWFYLSQIIVGIAFSIFLGDIWITQYQFTMILLSYIVWFTGLMLTNKKQIMIYIKQFKTFNYRKIFRYAGLGIVLWIGVRFLNVFLLPFFPEYGDEISTMFNTYEFVLRFVAIVIGAPIVEEILFRGLVQDKFIELTSKHIGIWCQALVFGMLHPFGMQKIYAAVLGVGLGYAACRSKTVVSSTIMHATINGIGWVLGVLTMYMIG